MKKYLLFFSFFFFLEVLLFQTQGNNFSDNFHDEKTGSEMEIHFLYVGEADCIVFKYKDAKTQKNTFFVIDIGSNISLIKKKTDIVEYLKKIKAHEIEAVLLTHPHFDHFWNIDYLFQNFSKNKYGDGIKNFYFNTLYEDYENVKFTDFISCINYEKKVVRFLQQRFGEEYCKNKLFQNSRVHAGQVLFSSEDGKCKMTIVGPIKKNKAFNNNSIVLLITYCNKKILLMADAEEEEEKDIIEYCYKEKIDISNLDLIKIGHHGYNSSSSLELVERTKPRIVINSTGPHSLTGGIINLHEKSAIKKRWMDCRKNEKENKKPIFLSTQKKGNITYIAREKNDYIYCNN